MVIIEGKSGKSQILKNIILDLVPSDIRITLFDAIDSSIKLDNITTIANLNIISEQLLEWTKVSCGKYIEGEGIAFNYAVPLELKDKFIEVIKQIAKEYNLEPYVFLTVQNNGLDMIRVYQTIQEVENKWKII